MQSRTLLTLGTLLSGLALVSPHGGTDGRGRTADPGPEAPRTAEPALPPLPHRFQRGVAYAHSWRGGGYGTPSSVRTLEELRGLNVDWIALTPFGYQRTPGETRVMTIFDRPGHETDRAMEGDIRQARRLGMEVLLKPHIWIDHGNWPGAIAFEDPAEFEAWFESYGEMIRHYARFAAESGVGALSIGCELKGVSAVDEARWRSFIAELRSLYPGRLLYAANWDEFERVPWWDALDAVGINAYFPLSEQPDPTPEELMAGASEVRRRIEVFQRRVGKPVVFTEIGFGSVRGAAAQPWLADRSAPLDLELQRHCYEAVARTFSDAPWLEGVFWWKWFSAASEQPGGMDHDPFSPRNKPAERVIEAWYAARKPTNGADGPL